MFKFLVTVGIVILSLPALAQEKEPPVLMGKCPKTQIVGKADDCFKCHVPPKFSLKEALPDVGYTPPRGVSLIFKDGKPIQAYYLLKSIEDAEVKTLFDYARHHAINHVILEIHSPGGGLFDAWRIVGLMRAWKSEGKVVETRVYGFAASAGFLVFASGSKGHRFVSPHAEMMWHELLLAMFGLKITTPSDSEEESRVLRHLQDTANTWLAECSKMTKADIDAAIKKKEFWINGKQAIEKGFADHLIKE